MAPRLLGLRVRIPPEHGCWSVVSGVFCQVEVSVVLLYVVCFECAVDTSSKRRPRPTRAVEP